MPSSSTLALTRWIKKIHMWVGLLNFTILIIFGIIGIAASILPRPADRPRPAATMRTVAYVAPGNLDDQALANAIQAFLDIPLTSSPVPSYAIRRDEDQRLRVSLFTPAVRFETTLLENDGKLEISEQPFDVWQYLFHLHELTPRAAGPDWRLRVWTWYMELSIWSLILMALSGVYLWSAARPGYRWGQVSFAAGLLIFVGFYWWVR